MTALCPDDSGPGDKAVSQGIPLPVLPRHTHKQSITFALSLTLPLHSVGLNPCSNLLPSQGTQGLSLARIDGPVPVPCNGFFSKLMDPQSQSQPTTSTWLHPHLFVTGKRTRCPLRRLHCLHRGINLGRVYMPGIPGSRLQNTDVTGTSTGHKEEAKASTRMGVCPQVLNRPWRALCDS